MAKPSTQTMEVRRQTMLRILGRTRDEMASAAFLLGPEGMTHLRYNVKLRIAARRLPAVVRAIDNAIAYWSNPLAAKRMGDY